MVSVTARLVILSTVILATAVTVAFGQNAFDTGTPAESKGGTALLSTFAPDKIETVNLANGNLNVHIPLVTVGGRGSASFTIALSNNAKLWTGEQAFNSLDQITVGGTTYDDLLMRMENVIAIGSGWFILKAPAIKARHIEIDWLRRSVCSGNANGPAKVLTKVWLVLPDGSEIEMRDRATQGEPHATSVNPDCTPNNNDVDRGRVWYSTDGSAITYVTNADNGVVAGQLAGNIFLSDGTKLTIRSGGSCSYITDRNGNFVQISYNQPANGAVTYTDQLGRQVILEPKAGGASTGATVTITGYNGMADRVIQVDAALLGATDGSGTLVNLRADYRSVQLPIINGAYQDGSDVYPGPHTTLFAQSDVGFLMQNSVDQQPVVTQLNLLDGRKFQFRYNPFGELAEIVYPAGGISQIDYIAFGASICDQGGSIRPQLNRRVSQRRLLSNGTTVDGVWTYARDTATISSTTYPRVTVEAHQSSATGTLLMQEKHYFLNLDKQYLLCTAYRGNHGDGYEFWDNAKELQTERTTGSGTEIIKRSWEQRTPVLWGGVTASEQPANDPRVTQEDTLLPNGKMRRVAYEYDGGGRTINAFNNVTKVSEYDFGATDGSLGSLLREIDRNYVTNLNTYCYVNLLGTDNTCPPDSVPTNLAKAIHNRRLVASEIVKDGSGNVEAYSDFEYDNYIDDGTNGNHKPLVTNSGMVQYDSSWFSNFDVHYQPRGNVTRVRRLISGSPPPDTTGTYSTSYSQYDEAGNMVLTIGPRDNGTTILIRTSISYTDNFGDGSNPDVLQFTPASPTFALPTAVTNALSQSVKTQYDYTRGLASGVKDPNGTIAKSEFDVFDRPTKVTAAYAATPTAETTVTEMSYPTARANESKGSKQLDATKWLTSRAQFDGFGRTTLSSQTEDGKKFDNSPSYTIHVKTIYDGLGRPWKVSNPYRSSSATTDGWTRTTFDAAGRVTEVTSFGADASNTPPPDTGTTGSTGYSGSATTTYASEVTTVTDQASKKRRSTVDGLGRLVRVDEPDASGNLDSGNPPQPVQPTYYGYDARGNLTQVNQTNNGTAQTRRFAYDGLSRLIFAANPEQTISVDPVFTYNSQNFAVKYAYDASSNLTTKTDTRKNSSDQFIAVSYQYDVLNRVLTRSYNDGTPQVNYTYDTATNGIGRIASAEAVGVSKYNYLVYDALGRVTSSRQDTAGQNYSMSYSYNKAGMVMDETYPSTKVIHTEYDDAGRIAGVRNNATLAYYVGAAGADADNRFQYSAHGAVTAIKLGNIGTSLWERTSFNSRVQPTQIQLGTSAAPSSLLQLDYTYGATASTNNGNIQTQMITIGSTAMQQTYTYDPMNRLLTASETLSGQTRWTQSYGYDRVGNRTSVTNTGQDSGSLPPPSTAQVDTATNRLIGYLYDEAGNQRQDSSGRLLEYDAENRLKRLNSGAAIYTYDGDGRRVTKAVGSATTVFIYDVAGRLIAECDSTQSGSSTVTKYVTADHLGSTRVVTGSNGTAVARYDYLPFGEEMGAGVGARTTAMGYGGNDLTRQKFTSKERDAESKMDYFGARYYLNTEGRFSSVDPTRLSVKPLNPQSWNRYSYALNNTVALCDPNGKWSQKIHERIIDKAFPGLSTHQRDVLKRASARVDSILLGGQDLNLSYQHGMRAPWQSVKDAKHLAKEFIKTNEAIAAKDAAANRVEFVENLSDKALEAFGKALHTITDKLSPAHEGFQVWYGLPDGGPLTPFQALEDWIHEEQEKEISDPLFAEVVKAAQKAFEQTFGSSMAQWAELAEQLPDIGSEEDLNVRTIRAKYALSLTPCVLCESEEVYKYQFQISD
jgi:RHS repeat-associated protein